MGSGRASTSVPSSSCVTLTCAEIDTANKKKYEVRTSLYGLKANQYLTSEVLMDDDCNGGTDDYSQ